MFKNYFICFEFEVLISFLFLEPGLDEDKLLRARITKPILDTTVNIGEDAVFKLSVSGAPSPKVEWYLNGEKIEADGKHKFEVKDNVHKLTIFDVKTSDAGKYSVDVHNRMGRDLVKATLIVKGTV